MKDLDLHPVFRAVADKNRRRMLDIVKENPGISVNQLSEHFSFSRFAVMKHMRLLERAALLQIEKEGRYRRIYLNAVPIQMITDRWLSSYSRLWSAELTGLKYTMEGRTKLMARAAKKKGTVPLKQIFTVFIRTTKEELWKAITSSESTQKYYFGCRLNSSLKTGASMDYEHPDGKGGFAPMIRGKVIEVIPLKKLVHTFQMAPLDSVLKGGLSRVTYELEAMGDMVRLKLTHDKFAKTGKIYKDVAEGWPMILSSLKSLLETGRALPVQM